MLNLPGKAIDIIVFHWLLLQHVGGGGGCLNMEPVVSYPSFDCRFWSHWRRWYAITRLSWPCFTITPRSRGRGLASCLAWCLVALVGGSQVYGVFLERIASPTYCWLPHPGALYFGIEYVTICCGGQIYIPLCVAPYNRALGHILVEEAADRSPLWDLRSEQDLIWDLRSARARFSSAVFLVDLHTCT